MTTPDELKSAAEPLLRRAKRAEEIVSEIETLTNADPHRSGARVSMTDWNTGTAYLADDKLKNVIATGRLELLRRLKLELQEIIIEKPKVEEPGES